MTQHPKRYGTLAHVKERKRILERMIAGMPENQAGTAFICRKCLKSFDYDSVREIALTKSRFDNANCICVECDENSASGCGRKSALD